MDLPRRLLPHSNYLLKSHGGGHGWSFLCFFALISGAVAIIIYVREKSQREINEYLESELAERTRLVHKQKDEIELQNIEITDSINYAKRIQSSILPDVNKLRETFKDAFIIFHPRDIVSGDFYWFDRIDNRFVIVCADSTGHGVPGAFMSMIGSTLCRTSYRERDHKTIRSSHPA